MGLLKWITGLLIGFAALTGVALAHVSLKASNIAAGAIIETLPDTFTIEFSQPVGLASFAIETDKSVAVGGAAEKGAPVALNYAPPKRMQAKFDIPLPRLSPGAYVAIWRTISKDGHAMASEIRFTLAAPKAP